MPKTVTRTICGICGNTKQEVRSSGPWFHKHEWYQWTGEEYVIRYPRPRIVKGVV